MIIINWAAQVLNINTDLFPELQRCKDTMRRCGAPGTVVQGHGPGHQTRTFIVCLLKTHLFSLIFKKRGLSLPWPPCPNPLAALRWQSKRMGRQRLWWEMKSHKTARTEAAKILLRYIENSTFLHPESINFPLSLFPHGMWNYFCEVILLLFLLIRYH